jgi:hypothetical protein
MAALERLRREFSSRGLAVILIGLPTTFVVGRGGRAVAFAVGPRRWESAPARALIETLLTEPAPGAAAQ